MIVGIDFSLTSTGVCKIVDGEATCMTIKTKPEQLWWEFPARVQGIADEIASWVDGSGEVFLVIESPAFSAVSSSLHRMFGGWWLLLNHLIGVWGFDVPVRVTPAQVKKYATGKGNAGKDAVLLAVARRYPDVVFQGNDEADAFVLAVIGAGVYGCPFGVLTKYQQEVVDAVRVKEFGESK